MIDGNVRIIEFEKKLEIFKKVLPLRVDLQPIDSSEMQFAIAVWKAAGRILGLNDTIKQAWRRYRTDNSLPTDLFQGLRLMFLGLTNEMLEAESMEELQVLLRPRLAAYSKHEAAQDHVRVNRLGLTKKIRPYYREMDSDTSFPMIIRPGWLPKNPIRITVIEEKKLIKFSDEKIEDVIPPRLDGLDEPLHELAKRLRPDMVLYDAPCYWVIDINFTAGQLQLGRGPINWMG